MEVSVGFSFRILRIISCKMVISVRVFQRGILAGVPECAPCSHSPCRTQGFRCWPGKGPALGHHRGQPGARSPVGFLHRPVYGELGLEAAGTPTPASPLLISCGPPAWFQEPFKALGGRKHTSGTAPLQPPSSGVRSLDWGFIIGAPRFLLPGHYALHPRPLCNNPQPLFSF